MNFRRATFTLLLISSLFVTTHAPAQSAFTINPSMSASWFNPDEGGHGIMIHILDENTAWLCWFTFDNDGGPAWICALGSISGDTMIFEQAFTVDGGNFPPFFNPDQIVEVPWGSITVVFVDCDSAFMEWTTAIPGFQSGSMPLVRLTSLWGNECQESSGASINIPRSSVPVVIDGEVTGGEWDDGVEVDIIINEEWTVPVRLKNDGMNLYVLFANVSGPNDENRVNVTNLTTTFPELFVDISPNDTDDWDNSNYWFHMSFQDCFSIGFYGTPNNCQGSHPGWAATNWPLGETGDHTEMQIEFSRLNLIENQAQSVRLMATMTSSLQGNFIYYNWPHDGQAHLPDTWFLAHIE